VNVVAGLMQFATAGAAASSVDANCAQGFGLLAATSLTVHSREQIDCYALELRRIAHDNQ